MNGKLTIGEQVKFLTDLSSVLKNHGMPVVSRATTSLPNGVPDKVCSAVSFQHDKTHTRIETGRTHSTAYEIDIIIQQLRLNERDRNLRRSTLIEIFALILAHKQTSQHTTPTEFLDADLINVIEELIDKTRSEDN